MKLECENCCIVSEVEDDIEQGQKLSCLNCGQKVQDFTVIPKEKLARPKEVSVIERTDETVIKVSSKKRGYVIAFNAVFAWIFFPNGIEAHPIVIVLFIYFLYSLLAELLNTENLTMSLSGIQKSLRPIPILFADKRERNEDIYKIDVQFPIESKKIQGGYSVTAVLCNGKKVLLFEDLKTIESAAYLKELVENKLISYNKNRYVNKEMTFNTQESRDYDSLVLQTNIPFMSKISKFSTLILTWLAVVFTALIVMVVSEDRTVYAISFLSILLFSVILFFSTFLSPDFWGTSLIAKVDKKELFIKYTPLSSLWAKKVSMDEIENIYILRQKNIPIALQILINSTLITNANVNYYFMVETKSGKKIKIRTPIEDTDLLIYIAGKIKDACGIKHSGSIEPGMEIPT